MLGALFPGAGHFHAGAHRSGFLLAALGAVTLAAAASNFVAPDGAIRLSTAALPFYVVLILLSVPGAHRAARSTASTGFDEARRARKNAWNATAGGCSCASWPDVAAARWPLSV